MYWISEFYRYFNSLIIRINYHYESGYQSIRAIPMNFFDMGSAFKMSDGKKQKSTKLLQNFCCSVCGKEMTRLSGLRNGCTSTSRHSATMPILAIHLIGRSMKLGGKMLWQMMRPQNPCPKKMKYFSLFILFIKGQNMVSNDVN